MDTEPRYGVLAEVRGVSLATSLKIYRALAVRESLTAAMCARALNMVSEAQAKLESLLNETDSTTRVALEKALETLAAAQAVANGDMPNSEYIVMDAEVRSDLERDHTLLMHLRRARP